MSDKDHPGGPRLLDVIPDPQAIRARLGEVLREANLLRSTLRLAERKQQMAQAAKGREAADAR
jgi:hypothetical protein